MIKTRNYTLTSTPQALTVDTAVDAPLSISIQNTSLTGYAYIGGPDVSNSAYGFKLLPAQTLTMELAAYDDIYAVGETGVTLAVLTVDEQ